MGLYSHLGTSETLEKPEFTLEDFSVTRFSVTGRSVLQVRLLTSENPFDIEEKKR